MQQSGMGQGLDGLHHDEGGQVEIAGTYASAVGLEILAGKLGHPFLDVVDAVEPTVARERACRGSFRGTARGRCPMSRLLGMRVANMSECSHSTQHGTARKRSHPRWELDLTPPPMQPLPIDGRLGEIVAALQST